MACMIFSSLLPLLDLYYTDPAQFFVSAGQDLDDLYVDDLSVCDLSVGDMSVDNLSVDDLSVDDLCARCVNDFFGAG